MKFTTLLAAVLLAACAPQAAEVGTAVPAASSQACAAPGAIRKVCRRQVDRCVTPYKDAGKTCTDNAQCEGDCLVKGDARPEGNVGMCQKDNDPCGCRTSLVAGKVDRSICVD